MNIIEFNGLPGCGKSTICNEVLKKFSKDKIISLDDVINLNSENRIKNMFNLIKILINLKLFGFNIRIIKFSLRFGFDYTRLIFAARLIKFNGNLHYYSKEYPEKIVILEEGYIQYLTSIPHNFEVVITKELKDIVKYVKANYNLTYIHCEIDDETNYNRLSNRNFTASRFDALSKKELEEILKIKYKNICTFRSLMDNKREGIYVDTSELVDINMRLIIKGLNLNKKLTIDEI
jgi:gluconate kinase